MAKPPKSITNLNDVYAGSSDLGDLGDLPGLGSSLADTDEHQRTHPALENPFEKLKPTAEPQVQQIWAIGGGKGGVGKSLIASSLAISLARLGHEVVAIDLDLGGANLHTTLGVDLPAQTLSDFLTKRAAHLQDCVIPTSIPRLKIISGAQDATNVTHLNLQQKTSIIQSLRTLKANYVILDLGAGTSTHTVDFFLSADQGLVATLPEPTSIENVYRFIKTAYYRRLAFSKNLKEVKNLVQMAMDPKNRLHLKTPADLYREVNKVSPEAGMKLKQEIDKIRPRLIVNQARTQTDIDIGFSIKTVCKRYFGIELDYLGYIDYDSSVWQAVRRKKPIMMEFPNSRLVSSVDRIVQYLLKKHADVRNELF